MWTIHAMRDLNAADPVGVLGPRVTPAPTPAPAPVKRGDGFVEHPDGTLSTDLPDPTEVAQAPMTVGGVPVWPFSHMPKQEDPDDDYPPVAAPPVALRVGDRVRLLPGHQWFKRNGPGPFVAHRFDRDGFFLQDAPYGGVCQFRKTDWERA